MGDRDPREAHPPDRRPPAIIDVLLGALAIADGKVDLATYAEDMSEAGAAAARIARPSPRSRTCPAPAASATATVEGDLPPPTPPRGGKKRLVRL